MKSKDQVDICIIGSGAGGGVATYALAMAGFSVAVLEAGPRFNPAHYPLNQKDWETRPSAFNVPPKDANKHLYTHGDTQKLDPSFSHLRSWTKKFGAYNPSKRQECLLHIQSSQRRRRHHTPLPGRSPSILTTWIPAPITVWVWGRLAYQLQRPRTLLRENRTVARSRR